MVGSLNSRYMQPESGVGQKPETSNPRPVTFTPSLHPLGTLPPVWFEPLLASSTASQQTGVGHLLGRKGVSRRAKPLMMRA